MLDNVHDLDLGGQPVPKLRRKPRARQSKSPLVDTRSVPRAAVQKALELAGGDASRLVFLPDGAVLVTNQPRQVQPQREPRR